MVHSCKGSKAALSQENALSNLKLLYKSNLLRQLVF